MKKQYIYFISYAWYSDTQNGHGNAEIVRDEKITGWEDVKVISTDLLNNASKEYGNNLRIIILNFQEF